MGYGGTAKTGGWRSWVWLLVLAGCAESGRAQPSTAAPTTHAKQIVTPKHSTQRSSLAHSAKGPSGETIVDHRAAYGDADAKVWSCGFAEGDVPWTMDGHKRILIWRGNVPEKVGPIARANNGLGTSPTGRWLALGLDEGGFQIVDLRSGKTKRPVKKAPVGPYDHPTRYALEIEWSADETTIAASVLLTTGTPDVLVYSPTSFKKRLDTWHSRPHGYAAALTKDGSVAVLAARQISSSYRRDPIEIHTLANGAKNTFDVPDRTHIADMVLLPNDRDIVLSYDYDTVEVWRFNQKKRVAACIVRGLPQLPRDAATTAFSHIAAHPSKAFLLGQSTRSAHVVNLDTCKLEFLWKAPPKQEVYCAEFSPSGDKVVVGGSDGKARVFRWRKHRTQGHTSAATGAR